jgi:hypothetical protein
VFLHQQITEFIRSRHSSFEVVLRTIEYKSLSWSRPLRGDNSPMSSGLILSKNRCYKGRVERSNDSRVEGGLDLMSSASRVGVLL